MGGGRHAAREEIGVRRWERKRKVKWLSGLVERREAGSGRQGLGGGRRGIGNGEWGVGVRSWELGDVWGVWRARYFNRFLVLFIRPDKRRPVSTFCKWILSAGLANSG